MTTAKTERPSGLSSSPPCTPFLWNRAEVVGKVVAAVLSDWPVALTEVLAGYLDESSVIVGPFGRDRRTFRVFSPAAHYAAAVSSDRESSRECRGGVAASSRECGEGAAASSPGGASAAEAAAEAVVEDVEVDSDWGDDLLEIHCRGQSLEFYASKDEEFRAHNLMAHTLALADGAQSRYQVRPSSVRKPYVNAAACSGAWKDGASYRLATSSFHVREAGAWWWASPPAFPSYAVTAACALRTGGRRGDDCAPSPTAKCASRAPDGPVGGVRATAATAATQGRPLGLSSSQGRPLAGLTSSQPRKRPRRAVYRRNVLLVAVVAHVQLRLWAFDCSSLHYDPAAAALNRKLEWRPRASALRCHRGHCLLVALADGHVAAFGGDTACRRAEDAACSSACYHPHSPEDRLPLARGAELYSFASDTWRLADAAWTLPLDVCEDDSIFLVDDWLAVWVHRGAQVFALDTRASHRHGVSQDVGTCTTGAPVSFETDGGVSPPSAWVALPGMAMVWCVDEIVAAVIPSFSTRATLAKKPTSSRPNQSGEAAAR